MQTESTETEEVRPQVRRQTRAVLVYLGSAAYLGAPAGERLWFLDDGLLIGRRAPADGRGWILDDRRVSAQHARIRRQGEAYFVDDLGSRNGTLVDGVPVSGTARLHEGSLLFVAGHAAVLRRLSESDVAAIKEDASAPFGPVATASAVMATSLRRLRLLARANLPVLITGETGVGKEVFARAVHTASGRAGQLMAVNCAALPSELVESELFGYERGAHSQARERKPGLIEQAQGGTLFLDEIGDMPLAAQAKLLRFLDTSEFLALGATRPTRMSARVLAATSHLESEREVPGLRADLAARLAGDHITLPPLRSRPEDLGALLAHFLRDRGAQVLSSSAFLALCLYHWPKNVRELQRVIQEAATLAQDEEAITPEHLPSSLAARVQRPGTPKRRSPRPLPAREELECLLAEHQGNVAEVARALDRQWAVIYRAIQRHGLDPTKWQPGNLPPGGSA